MIKTDQQKNKAGTVMQTFESIITTPAQPPLGKLKKRLAQGQGECKWVTTNQKI